MLYGNGRTRKMPKFIGIGHKKQTGKSTFAELLASRLSHLETRIVSFAAPLKKLARDCYGLSYEQTDGDLKETECHLTNLDLPSWVDEWGGKSNRINTTYHITPRQLLQDLGLTLREAIPGIWSRAPFRGVYPDHVKYVIIPDVRFEDELMFVRDRKGILIKVNRKIPEKDTHVSEVELDAFEGWDIVVDNNGTLVELEREAGVVKEFIKNK